MNVKRQTDTHKPGLSSMRTFLRRRTCRTTASFHSASMSARQWCSIDWHSSIVSNPVLPADCGRPVLRDFQAAPGRTNTSLLWKACEEELLRITELFNKRLAQCYAESGVSLEYTPADVEAAFRRHRL